METLDETILQKAIGHRLRAQRESLGLGLVEACTRIGTGLSRQALGAYELGRRPIPAATLASIAKAYGASVRSFYPDDGTDPPAWQDITVRVRTEAATDLDAVEAALVRAAHEVGQGGRIVSTSLPYRVDPEPVDVRADG